MDFDEVITKRRSIREYAPGRSISEQQLEKLFDQVRLTPSARNLQQWEFIIVRDPENKKKLRECANNQKHVEDASAVIIAVGTKNLVLRAEMTTKDFAAKEALLAKLKDVSPEKAKVWAIQNVSLAVMSLTLAAANMGLSSCILAAFDPEKVRIEFGIPADYEPVLLVTLGYQSKPAPERPMKLGFDDIIHFEKFGKKP
jgi:putative NAD(P)H nitroreductase